MSGLTPEQRWQRFAAGVRHVAVAPAPTAAPPGFIARVLNAQREFFARLWERWSWRGAIMAALVAAACAWFVQHQFGAAPLAVPQIDWELPVPTSQ
jgi:hypothetical protein